VTRRISTGNGFSSGGLGAILVQGSTLSTSGNSNLTLAGSGTGVVTTPDVLNVTNTGNAASVSTGAVRVSGGAAVVENTNVGGYVFQPSGWNSGSIGSVTPQPARFTNFTSQDTSTFAEIAEVIATKTGATGTVVHDFTEANTWYHSSISANFTANFTNVPTTNNRNITLNLILAQGATTYYPTAVQIAGAAQTVNWLGSTPKANNTEIITFTLIRTGSAWTVTGSISSHGAVKDGSTAALAADDAFALIAAGQTTSGNYWINLPRLGPTQMYCDLTTAGGGWMMFGYLGSVSGIGNTQQAVFSIFGNIGTGRTSNGTSFCRFDIAKVMPGAAPGTTQMMWRRSTDSNPIIIHSMDELFNRAATNPAVNSPLLNFGNNPNNSGIGYPIQTFMISNSGPAGLKRVGGARYESNSGTTYPGIAWNSAYDENSDGAGSYTEYLNRRSLWYWETNGVESNNQWSHASPLQMGPSVNATTGTGRKDFELYFRVNPLGNS